MELVLSAWGLALGLWQAPPQGVEVLPAPARETRESLQELEILPQPRPLRMPRPAVLVPYYDAPYYRMSLYGVDRYGYFRPKVVYGPYGAFYLGTGEPYPHIPIKGIP
jgi:hypothetical protein